MWAFRVLKKRFVHFYGSFMFSSFTLQMSGRKKFWDFLDIVLVLTSFCNLQYLCPGFSELLSYCFPVSRTESPCTASSSGVESCEAFAEIHSIKHNMRVFLSMAVPSLLSQRALEPGSGFSRQRLHKNQSVFVQPQLHSTPEAPSIALAVLAVCSPVTDSLVSFPVLVLIL